MAEFMDFLKGSLLDPKANKERLASMGAPGYSRPEPQAQPTQPMANTPQVTTSGNSGMGRYRQAIANIESRGSGDYAAIGPRHKEYGRALGRYQVMEANLPGWSREALGREVTADEFLQNENIQDAIFDHKFGQYVNQYGEEGAAQAWFGGPKGVGKLDRKDSFGTSIGQYTNKFRGEIGGTYDQKTAQQIIQQATANGATPQQAAAMAASGMLSSVSNPTAYRKEGGTFGTFGWKHDSISDLRDFADRTGKDMNDLSTEISFLMNEAKAHENVVSEIAMSGQPGASMQAYTQVMDERLNFARNKEDQKHGDLASRIYTDFFGEQDMANRPVLEFGGDIPSPGSAGANEFDDQFSRGQGPGEFTVGDETDPLAMLYQDLLRPQTGKERLAEDQIDIPPELMQQIMESTQRTDERDAMLDYYKQGGPNNQPGGMPQAGEAPQPEDLGFGKAGTAPGSDPLQPEDRGFGQAGTAPGSDPLQPEDRGFGKGEITEEAMVEAGATGNIPLAGSGIPLDMGTTEGTTEGGGGTTSTSGTAPPPAPEEATEESARTWLDKLYGTEGLSDDERTERRRRMSAAFIQGLQRMTLRGEGAGIDGIYNASASRQAMSAEQEATEVAQQQQQQQAAMLGQMATDMGLGEFAPLAAMGADGANTLRDMMYKKMSTDTEGGGGFSMTPESRARLAQFGAQLDRPGAVQTLLDPDAPPELVEYAAKEIMQQGVPDAGAGGGTELDPANALGSFNAAIDSMPDGPNKEAARALAPLAAGDPQLQDDLMGIINGDKAPSDVAEFEFFENLTPDQQKNYLNMQQAKAGAGQTAFKPAPAQLVDRLSEAATTKYAENRTGNLQLYNAARDQFLTAANPSYTPGMLQATVQSPAFRIMAGLVGEDVAEGILGVSGEEVTLDRFMEGIRNSQLGNLAQDVPGQLSNLEGDRLLQGLAAAADKRTEQLLMSQYVMRNTERQTAVVDAITKYQSLPPEEQTLQGYDNAVKAAIESVPVIREMTPQEHYDMVASFPRDDNGEPIIPREQRGEIILVKVGPNDYRTRTVGDYPEDN